MKPKIIVTGAIGFIGTNLVLELNKKGFTNLILVDHKNPQKTKHLKLLTYQKYYDKKKFLELVKKDDTVLNNTKIIFHLGACSDTTEKDKKYLLDNNTKYSKELYKFSVKKKLRFIYASSAATYGDGSHSYSDKERKLKPLNFYGLSKYLFDEWVLDQKKKPQQVVGLKFFNVYGPYEEHKGRMASVVFHGFHQLKKEGVLKLFKSYKKGIADGEQKRDFIYVKDVVDVMMFFMRKSQNNGVYNVGTGKADTFLNLGNGLFKALRLSPQIQFIEMPETLKKKYQYFTEADMKSLRKVGYKKKFTPIDKGISDYVRNYLEK